MSRQGTTRSSPSQDSTVRSGTPPMSVGNNSGTRKPTAEQIRKRAFEIYQARRGAGGSPEQDWLQAERELVRELNR